MADEHAQVRDLVRAPEPRGTVVRASEEVMPMWPPRDVPHSVVVAFVDDQAGPGVEGPETDRFIGGAGQEMFGCCCHR